jgi:sorting nexin-22/24
MGSSILQIKKLMKTPEFPPKKVLKWNSKVLEQRRLGLEAYLQGVVFHEAVPKAVFEFLEIAMEEDME